MTIVVAPVLILVCAAAIAGAVAFATAIATGRREGPLLAGLGGLLAAYAAFLAVLYRSIHGCERCEMDLSGVLQIAVVFFGVIFALVVVSIGLPAALLGADLGRTLRRRISRQSDSDAREGKVEPE